MKRFRDASIRSKLTILITVTTGIALLLACAAFLIADRSVLRKSMLEDMAMLAQLTAMNIAGAVVFDDRDGARETLENLRAEGHVLVAALYGIDGGVMAKYSRGSRSALELPPPRSEEFLRFAPSGLEIFRKVVLDGEDVGGIFIRADLRKINEPLLKLTYIVGIIIAGTLATTILLSLRLQRSITSPIQNLAKLARNVEREKDFSHRAKKYGNDEIGVLIDGFNRMMVEIQKRDFELSKANDEITALNERLNTENLRLSAEVEVTRQLQRMVLPRPDELRTVPGLDIAGYMEPADEVGGDYYDVLQYNGKFKMGMGDVTGHGLESGVLMLMTQMGIRTLLTSDESDPTRFLSTLNRTLYDNVQRMGIDKNLTLMLLDYTPPHNGNVGGRLRVSGQHEELIVVRQGGQVERVDTLDLGFPVALDEDIADFVNHVDIELEPGDGVVLYTDGITEAENSDGVQYKVEKLCSVISNQWGLSAENVKNAIIDDVRKHIGGHTVFDDITLLVLKQKLPDAALSDKFEAKS